MAQKPGGMGGSRSGRAEPATNSKKALPGALARNHRSGLSAIRSHPVAWLNASFR